MVPVVVKFPLATMLPVNDNDPDNDIDIFYDNLINIKFPLL